ncbi:MAG: RNA recognition motif domain-containing protein [Candidatus Villigracilaceae bacterium]
METKLYVGNLPYSFGEADLQTLFAGAGTVKSAVVIKDRDSGRSKGFGFVEMETAEEMRTAISMFNGKEVEGRPLTVNQARPQEERRPGGGRDFHRGGYGGRGGNDRGGGRRRNW